MKVSVVCPFYNEESIIFNAAKGMLENLKSLSCNWELIAVDDGSNDNSLKEIKRVFDKENNAEVIGYVQNQGRGHALKTGINSAIGDIIITTEIDLSWGDNIVKEIIEKFEKEPQLDAVIASPNLKYGEYKNVPFKRVLVSKLGNFIIRWLFTKNITMNTGMTRGYKRSVIKPLQIDEKGKEFHLEVLLKLVTLGYNISEIPAVLEWKDQKLMSGGSKKRISSSKTKKLIFTHLNFAVFANPIRYFWLFSTICIFGSFFFISVALQRLFYAEASINLALIGLLLALFSLIFFGFGIIATQNIRILKEIWRK